MSDTDLTPDPADIDPAPPEGAAAVADEMAAEPPGASDPAHDDGGGADEAPPAEGGASAHPVDVALGVIRLGVGAALVAAPGWAGRIWVGPGADGPGSLVFARALGARDVALGARILMGLRKGQPVDHWVAAGFGADLADVAATLIAGRHLTPARRVAMPLIAGAVAAGGLLSGRRARS